MYISRMRNIHIFAILYIYFFLFVFWSWIDPWFEKYAVQKFQYYGFYLNYCINMKIFLKTYAAHECWPVLRMLVKTDFYAGKVADTFYLLQRIYKQFRITLFTIIGFKLIWVGMYFYTCSVLPKTYHLK